MDEKDQRKGKRGVNKGQRDEVYGKRTGNRKSKIALYLSRLYFQAKFDKSKNVDFYLLLGVEKKATQDEIR